MERGKSSTGEGCWDRARGEGGVDGGLTSQKGRALIRTPASEALCPSWAPPGLCQLSLLEPHPPSIAKPPTFKLPCLCLFVARIIITGKDKGLAV